VTGLKVRTPTQRFCDPHLPHSIARRKVSVPNESIGQINVQQTPTSDGDDEHNARRPMILIIESHPGIALLFQRIFASRGWSVTLRGRPDLALAYAARNEVAAVVWDYSRDLTTEAAVRALREALHLTPLVLTSTSEAAIDVAARLGVPLLKQPFSLDEAERTLQTAMGRRRRIPRYPDAAGRPWRHAGALTDKLAG
jgi:CheY-like chemotaxis protein